MTEKVGKQKETINGINLRNVGKTAISENKLFTTYTFYADNKKEIKPYARWNASERSWTFQDLDALEKIKEAFRRAGMSERIEKKNEKNEEFHRELREKTIKRDTEDFRDWLGTTDKDVEEEIEKFMEKQKEVVRNLHHGLEENTRKTVSEAFRNFFREYREARENAKKSRIIDFSLNIREMREIGGYIRCLADGNRYDMNIKEEQAKDLMYLADDFYTITKVCIRRSLE